MDQITPPQRRLYYGWVIVGLSMLSMTWWFGIRTSFSVFFVALIDQFHWSRTETAGAYSIAMLAYMIMAPVIGTLVDRIGPRKVILPGIVLTGLGLLLCAQIETLIQFYLFFGVILGAGITCLSIAPYTVILSHWFEKKRGIANGFAGVGLGLGTLLLVPLAQYLISLWGWRSAFLILSLLILIIPLPLNGLFLRHRPQEMGLLPDGNLPHDDIQKKPPKNEDTSLNPSSAEEVWTLGKIVKSAQFWYVILFPSFATFGTYIIIVHHIRYLVDLGVDKFWAASLFAVVGAVSAGFKPIWGCLSDRAGREFTFTLGEICFCLGIISLILFQYIPSRAFLYLFAGFYGPGWGVTTPIIMSVAGDIYKGKRFGLIYGIVEGVIGIGGAAGAWVAGLIFDRTNSYLWAFVLVILLNLISVLLVWLSAPRKFRRPSLPI
jgi:MFS family permease